VRAFVIRATLLASAVMALFSAGAARADDFTFKPNVSTLGFGVEGAWRIDPRWGVRLGANAAAFDFTYHDKDADLVSKALLLSLGATADYYPFDNGFRLEGGLRASANKIEGSVRNIKRHVGKGKNQLTVLVPNPLTTFTVTQNPVQPYLGLGYSVKIEDRVSLDFDLGALYAGEPDIDVDSHAHRYGFSRKAIDREIRHQQDRISAYQVYPVAQIGLTFRF